MTLFSSAKVAVTVGCGGGVGVATTATPISVDVSSKIGSSLMRVVVGAVCSSLTTAASSTTSIGSILGTGGAVTSTTAGGGVAAWGVAGRVWVAVMVGVATAGRVLSEKTSSLSKSTEHVFVLCFDF